MQLGRYTLDELIGEGGFGQVWRGTLTGEMGFAKTVAIKVLRPELSLDEERTQALIHEALLGARLKHRNIVEVHEFTRIEGRRIGNINPTPSLIRALPGARTPYSVILIR